MDSPSDEARNSSAAFSEENNEENERDEPFENSQDNFQDPDETEEQLDEVNDLPEGAAAKKMVELARAIYDSTPSIDKGKPGLTHKCRKQKDVKDFGKRKERNR